MVYKYSIANWQKTKSTLMSLMQDINFTRNQYELVESNYAETLDMTYAQHNTAYILYEYITKFAKEIEKNLSLERLWYERQYQDDVHPVHDHGDIGWSGIVYLQFDKTKHTGTIFESGALDVNEGDICFFPSYLSHWTIPNSSESERIVISFNLSEVI